MKNFAEYVKESAKRFPKRLALSLPDYQDLTSNAVKEEIIFEDFWSKVESYAEEFKSLGVSKGHRIIVLIPFSIDLYAMVIALFAIGAVVVLIDAGLPKKKFIHCMKVAKAQGIISTNQLFRYRFFIGALFKIKLKMVFGGSGWGLKKVGLAKPAKNELDIEAAERDMGALITFTSGSTGMPKGADRSQDILTAQHLSLEESFPHWDGMIDCPCFPVVVLHNLCLGATSIMPAVDFKNVSGVNPEWIIDQVQSRNIDSITGAPAYMEKICNYALSKSIKLENIKRVGVGGAPVSAALSKKILSVFNKSECEIIYGSTEAEPIASVSMSSFVDFDENDPDRILGFPAGKLHHCATVKLIKPSKGAVILDGGQKLNDLEVDQGQPGELIVSGKHVNRSYFENPEADLENKIKDENGIIWHRTGDISICDHEDYFWLGGRIKSVFEHEGKTILPLTLEMRLAKEKAIRKSAVHKFSGQAIVWIEVESQVKADKEELMREILRIAELRGLRNFKTFFIDKIPMDARHNSKTEYSQLEELAKERLA